MQTSEGSFDKTRIRWGAFSANDQDEIFVRNPSLKLVGSGKELILDNNNTFEDNWSILNTDLTIVSYPFPTPTPTPTLPPLYFYNSYTYIKKLKHPYLHPQ